MKSLLLIDEDLGFLLWLGGALLEAGYNVLPAKDIREATILIDQFQAGLDGVIVDVSLAGATRLIDILWRSNRSLRALLLLGENDFDSKWASDVAVTIRKPLEIEGAAGSSWLKAVKHLMAGYSSLA